MNACPLCHQPDSEFYHQDKRRIYRQCQRCQLVFVEPHFRLDADAEKACYDHHENDPYNDGYRQFLSRMSTPLCERINTDAKGLDFGCGPGPALAYMLREQGYSVNLYDIYYHPDPKPLSQTYDFVTATEVIEHLYQPDIIWSQWLNLLNPGGWLGVMTKMVIDVEAFASWHYKNDVTHVCFYSRATFEYLANRDGLQLDFIGNDVILLRKPEHES
ncbi:2-polyprenyl-3-methyl-5-hydroxy-6-metoxy-1,4-benzoquinol methylase [Vibrio sp. qd031]|uniref:class I SAM-dependent methyltransferase n=1 Tax=Vibrio sp. qd031 TaxID=1603038 RepID=UPI000A0FDAED|nr:class I SAM-dependent methyltransferase [Vibrio sp. qd031]ORT51687.1 2-polyprenyl-3-methyl-5-hydroxy-6-metoxy-1,4-benzoquinol methylase [Vibrio sp. qd031]